MAGCSSPTHCFQSQSTPCNFCCTMMMWRYVIHWGQAEQSTSKVNKCDLTTDDEHHTFIYSCRSVLLHAWKPTSQVPINAEDHPAGGHMQI